jgi:hypothetical protein
VIAHWGFDLHFPGDSAVEHFFYMLGVHLYVFFEEMSVPFLHPFSIGFFFMLLSCEGSLHILSDTWFRNSSTIS